MPLFEPCAERWSVKKSYRSCPALSRSNRRIYRGEGRQAEAARPCFAALPTWLLLPAGWHSSAGLVGWRLPPVQVHSYLVHSGLVHAAPSHRSIAQRPLYPCQPQCSSAPAYRASTPTQPGFLQACTWRLGTRQSAKGQVPPAPEPRPAQQEQRPPQPQKSSAATCLQMCRNAHRRCARGQQKLSLNSLAPNPHVAAGHQRPGKPSQKMQRLGPGQTGSKAHTCHAQHGPNFELAL